jgi:spermidine/putrescine transport system permease protein
MYSRTSKAAVALPPLVWVALFLLLPYAILFVHSFWRVSGGVIVHQWNLENYAELWRNPMYLTVLLRSMKIAGSVTLFALLLAYPLAYFLSFKAMVRKRLLYQLVIIPLWVSYLVRAYAWKTILGSDGVLNTLLQYFHLTRHPVEALLYSPVAVVLTLTHIYTPFAFLPIYAALEHIPRRLLEASEDLGATPLRTFLRVILPLSLPGVLTGATFAFVLSLGDFLAPLLLGGPSGIMISNVVVSLFGSAYNWPLGAALSLSMLLAVVALISLVQWGEKKLSFT